MRSKGSSPAKTFSSVSTAMPHGEIGLQDRAAESLAGDFDLLGQKNFALARQQGDVPHLAQVHADGVARRKGRSYSCPSSERAMGESSGEWP